MGLALSARPAAALESEWVSADYVQAQLLSGAEATGAGKTVPAGLALRLDEGWHAYWRMPGDGGLPPKLNWDDSQNVESVKVYWPAPRRFETFGFYSFGYEEAVLLPLEITLKEPGAAAQLALEGDIMVCEEICVPQKVSLALEIPAGHGEHSEAMARIEAARTLVPAQENRSGLRIDNVVVGPAAIVVNAFSQRGFENADLFVESGDIYITAPPEITPSAEDPREAMLRIPAPEGIANLADYVTARNLTLTLVSGGKAVEKTIGF